MKRTYRKHLLFVRKRLAPLVALVCLTAANGIGATPQDSDLDQVEVDLEMPFPENPENVADLLQQIEENAIDIREGANRVAGFLELPAEYSFLTHSWRLSRIEARLAEVRVALNRLALRNDMLLDGQRDAFDLIQPAIVDLGTNLRQARTAIEAYRTREWEDREWTESYTNAIDEIAESAGTIVDAAALAESLSDVRLRLESLDSNTED